MGSGTGGNTGSSDQIFSNNSRIRITPMFGSGYEYMKKAKVTKEPVEYLHELSEKMDKVIENTDATAKSTTSSASSNKRATDALIKTQDDMLYVSP